MANAEKPHRWLEYCKVCKRRHRVEMRPCPGCSGRGGYTPQPVSDSVASKCYANYNCEGCMAYEAHLA